MRTKDIEDTIIDRLNLEVGSREWGSRPVSRD